MKEFFKKLAIPVALSTALSSAAMPVFAGKDFIKEDLRNEESKIVELVGARLSEDNLTFVVHGGNRELQMSAYRAAQRLDDEGIPIAFLLAPDRDNLDISMHVDFYMNGGSKYWVTAYDNDKSTPEANEQVLYEQAKTAYEYDTAVANAPSSPEYTIASN